MRINEDNNVTFRCIVDSNVLWYDEDIDEILVKIKVSSEHGWPIELAIQNFSLEPKSTLNFPVSVAVPPETSSDVKSKITIAAEVTTLPDAIVSTYEIVGYINIEQYYSLEIHCPDDTLEVLEGKTAEYRINIKNNGNGQDIVIFHISNMDELAQNGLNILLSKYAQEFEENETREIILYVDTLGSPSNADYDIHMKIRSEFYDAEEENLDLSLKVKRNYSKTFLIIGWTAVICFIIASAIYGLRKRIKK